MWGAESTRSPPCKSSVGSNPTWVQAQDAAAGAANGASAGPSGPADAGTPAVAAPLQQSPGQQERSARRVSFQPPQPAAAADAAAAGGNVHGHRGGGSGRGGGAVGSAGGSGRGSGGVGGSAGGSPGGSGHAGHAEGIRFTELRDVLRKLNFMRRAPNPMSLHVLAETPQITM